MRKLLSTPLAATRLPLQPYLDKTPSLPAEPDDLVRPSDAATILALPEVVRRTLGYSSPDLETLTFTARGRVNEATALLASKVERWGRASRDFKEIASELEAQFHPTGVSGWRHFSSVRRTPRSALALIAATDRLGAVQWTCVAPALYDNTKLERVRLGLVIAQSDARKRAIATPR